jgi:hypothetical protein
MEYTEDKMGFYQIVGADKLVEIRVALGRLGFKKEFKTKEDSLLNHILAFCKLREFVRVRGSISSSLKP